LSPKINVVAVVTLAITLTLIVAAQVLLRRGPKSTTSGAGMRP
jgi:hypothetical protein